MESLHINQHDGCVSTSIKAVQPNVKYYSAQFTDSGFIVNADG